MKLSPKYIITWAICPYLDKETEESLIAKLSKYKSLNDRKFITIINDFFDLERFLKSPVRIDDCLLYNYIQYEFTKAKLPKRGLILKYVKKINVTIRKDLVFLLG